MDVSGTLEAAKEKAQYKPVTVERLAPPTLDLGHLAIFDGNALDNTKAAAGGSDLEAYLTAISRDSAQLLYNAVFALDTTADADGVFVTLPQPITLCPREKPLPTTKPLTKWERFAKEKGIQNRKKSRMEFDEATGEYRPRWGYGSAKNDPANEWLIPVPDNTANPYEDLHEKRREEKNARVEKNKAQQRRNTAEAAAVQQGVDPRAARKAELEAKLRASKAATASRGVFDRKLDGDVKPKGVRRQFAPNTTDVAGERATAAELAAKVLRKQEKGETQGGRGIKAAKATGMLQRAEEKRNRIEKSKRAADGDSGKAGKKRRTK